MESTSASNAPLVSAIVPAYNAEAFIEQTLQSLLAQTYGNLEIIVVDDGSTDGTVHRVEAMARNDPRIRLLRQANVGVAAARNRGIEESSGDFVAPVDADDIWFPEAVARLVKCLVDADARTGVAYGWWVVVDEKGLLDGRFRCSRIEGNVLRTLICHNFLGNASSTLIRRACFREVGGYSSTFLEEGAQGCEDWDLYLRIADKFRFKVVPGFLFGYRKLASGLTANFVSMAASHQKVLELAAMRHPRLPAVVYRLSNSSFFLYLANESYYRGQPKEGLRWLGQALSSAPVFTLGRVVFYLSVFRNITASVSGIGRPVASGPFPLEANEGRRAGRRAVIQLADIERKRTSIFLKTALQNVLHRLVSGGTAKSYDAEKN